MGSIEERVNGLRVVRVDVPTGVGPRRDTSLSFCYLAEHRGRSDSGVKWVVSR